MAAGALMDQADQAETSPQAEQAGASLDLDVDCGSTGDTTSPHVALTGFSGSLSTLLDLARAERIDLASLSFADLLDQLLTAMDRPGLLLVKAGWVVVMANIVALRSRLLLPADNPERREAAEEAGRLRDRLAELQGVRGLAAWLEARPQLGLEVFKRGSPEWLGAATTGVGEFDVIEFLWAAVVVFDEEVVEIETVYWPVGLGLFSVKDAQDRVRRLLADRPDGCNLDYLLPVPQDDANLMDVMQSRSAWTSTFSAALELAKLGEVVINQQESFGTMHARYPETKLPSMQLAT